MKISELVNYLEELDKFDVDQSQLALRQTMTPVIHQILSSTMQFDSLSESVNQQFFDLTDRVNHFASTVDSVKQAVKVAIQQLEPAYFANSASLYQDMRGDTVEWILSRKLSLTSESEKFIVERLLRCTDWRWPGLIIRPGQENWIDHLVGLDPLYLVDQQPELLTPAVSKFNGFYQRRLRTYTAPEYTTEPLLESIPNNQIGFCFVYNFFNFKPVNIIHSYLEEIYQKLRPGGVIIFTYNDCDRTGGVRNAENFYNCYTPGRSIQDMLDELGYKILVKHHIDASNTWIEVKKPGDLITMRGGQVLAEILAY